METRKAPPASQPPATSASGPTPPAEQNQGSAWMTVLNPLLWFLVLPGAVLFLVKWLLGY
jgi:hypothetical protein